MKMLRFKNYISNLNQFLLNILSKITPNQRKLMKPIGKFYLKLGNDSSFKI